MSRLLLLLPLLLPLLAACARAEPLEIVSAGGTHAFDVEVADEPGERQRGLMFRRSLGADKGMLFDFEEAGSVSMWMKNTPIPLDMLFIREDGTVARIAASTEPFSLETIAAGEPVRYVLEVPGGTARRLGIRAGDTVRHGLIPGD